MTGFNLCSSLFHSTELFHSRELNYATGIQPCEYLEQYTTL